MSFPPEVQKHLNTITHLMRRRRIIEIQIASLMGLLKDVDELKTIAEIARDKYDLTASTFLDILSVAAVRYQEILNAIDREVERAIEVAMELNVPIEQVIVEIDKVLGKLIGGD
ncbi:MAG: hypothetical protein DRJ18_02225 [Candidatus Methanomethylicota archaeon]|nr:MAG: hypothetical protein DRJ18_02225 [Candidatus Verstraetearchaeota archaeon]